MGRDLSDRISRLENLFRAPPRDFAKRLAWEVLEFDPVDLPIADDLLPRALRHEVNSSTLLSDEPTAQVIHIVLASSTLPKRVTGVSLSRLRDRWANPLVVFSDYGCSRWCLSIPNRAPAEPWRAHVDAESPGAIARNVSAWKAGEPLRIPKKAPSPAAVAKSGANGRFVDPTNFFMEKLAKNRLLSSEEEIALSRLVQQGNRDARDQFILRNVRLVMKWVNKYRSRYSHSRQTFDDAFQEGILGLAAAAERFDPSYGTRFTTYAVYWINQSCRRGALATWGPMRLPLYVTDALRVALATSGRHSEETRSINRGADLLREQLPDSLKEHADTLYGFARATRLGIGIPDPGHEQSPLEAVMRREDMRNLDRFIAKLPYREKEIIEHRFGLHGAEELTLEQIGERFNLTRERIRQLEKATIESLREVIVGPGEGGEVRDSTSDSEGLAKPSRRTPTARKRRATPRKRPVPRKALSSKTPPGGDQGLSVAERIEKQKKNLPSSMRQVLHLRFVAGKTQAETARLMGMMIPILRWMEEEALKKI